jgi:hypothetical protein
VTKSLEVFGGRGFERAMLSFRNAKQVLGSVELAHKLFMNT